jgi:hypothetical protein
MYNMHHLWPNLQTRKKIFGKKILNVTTVQLFSNKKNIALWVFFNSFLFQLLIKSNYIPILWFATFYGLEMAPKIHNNSKFSKEQKMFANWAVDGKHYAFHENCLH